MVLVKDGAKMELDNNDHIAAFLSSGWVEAPASPTAAPVEERVEIEEIMNAPVEAEEKPEVEAPAPKRGRKKGR